MNRPTNPGAEISYDRLAQFYDWEHGRFREDLPLYLAYAAAAREGILDAACGTGRVLLALAEKGYSVTGVDSAAGMLEVARRAVRARKLDRKATLVHGDLRSLNLGRSFGMAMVALGSFHHLVSMEDQRSALAGLAGHLTRGGKLVLDLVNPTPEWLTAGDGAVVHQLTAPYPGVGGGEMLSKFVARTANIEDQSEHQLLIYDLAGPDGSLRRYSFQTEMRYVFRFEAELLLKEAGLVVRDVLGGYDLEPFSSTSTRMIIVAEKS